MPISQNARFSGKAAIDLEIEHPPGASIAKHLQIGLTKRGWDVSEIENWRDSGWSIICCRATSKLKVVIAKMMSDHEWLLQIAPRYVPGLVGSFLKKHPSATPDSTQ